MWPKGGPEAPQRGPGRAGKGDDKKDKRDKKQRTTVGEKAQKGWAEKGAPRAFCGLSNLRQGRRPRQRRAPRARREGEVAGREEPPAPRALWGACSTSRKGRRPPTEGEHQGQGVRAKEREGAVYRNRFHSTILFG